MTRFVLWTCVGIAVATVAAVYAGVSVRRAAASTASVSADPASPLKRCLVDLIAVVGSQESGKDATCWTTVRMMDAHFAGRPIHDSIAVLKIEACKTLVYQVWRAASLRNAAGSVEAADIDAVVPEAFRREAELMAAIEPMFIGDPSRAVMNRDYHRVTENKRYLYSILADAITRTGLFEGRGADLRPLSHEGANRLAAVATSVTTAFLTDCGKRAIASDHAAIEADDVRAAYLAAVAAFPKMPPEVAAAAGPAAPDPDLLSLSRKTIDNKIAALRAWNAKVWSGAADPDARQLELVNRLVKTPFYAASFKTLKERLAPYARCIAYGSTPMRNNAFTFTINSLPADPQSTEALPYVTLVWTRNTFEELFPRRIALNGDVTVDLMALPSVTSNDIPHSVSMLDYDLDALRDTTLHWTLLADAWSSPKAKAADPFALELAADRMSELALMFIRECDALAIKMQQSSITIDICCAVLRESRFGVRSAPSPAWGPEQERQKARVFAAYPAALFEDLSLSSGLVTAPAIGSAPRDPHAPVPQPTVIAGGLLEEYTGSGVAVGDVDGDGLVDLFLAADGGNRLLRNLGGHRFEDATARAGLVSTRDPITDSHHPLFVDFDNDGRLDLFLVCSKSHSRLFRQGPDGVFVDVTAASGIVTGRFAHDAVWFDYDNDGLLDCYVGQYGESKPSLDGRNGEKNLLFHNRGDGTFADVTDKAGVGSTGWTLATAAIDVDHDGFMDLFVANDYGRSELYRNRGDGTFEECGRRYGVDDRGSSMNASVVDVDGDGWMDVYISQIDMFSKSLGWIFPQGDSVMDINDRILKSTFYIAGNKLFRNESGKGFASIDERMFEPGDRGWSWSGNFFDYDNDGDDDMYLANGWIPTTPASDQANQFFIRDGGRFFQRAAGTVEAFVGNSRGVVAADLTGSGRIDLVVSNYRAQPRLLANACAFGNHWLKVRLHGSRSNRFGIGSVVKLARAGGPVQVKQVNCGANYLSQDDTTLTFGLASDETAQGLTVVWPGNLNQEVRGPFKADTTVEVMEDPAHSSTGTAGGAGR